MKRIVLVGYYGFGNLGDEMILAALVSSLRCADPGAEITVLSGDAEQTRRHHAVEAVPWNQTDRVIAAVAAAERVVIGGGGLFHDYWGVDPSCLLTSGHWGIAYYAGVAGLARALEIPYTLCAVGVGPLSTEDGRRLTGEVFSLAAGASVRDEESANLVFSLGAIRVPVAPDPAFAFEMPPSSARPAAATKRRIGVALRSWSIGVGRDPTERSVISALHELVAEQPTEIVLLPFQQHRGELEDDLAVAERLRGALGPGVELIAPTAGDPWAPVRAIAGLDLLIGMRLHALVTALRSGVPVVGLSYDPKVAALLGQVGAGRYALALERLQPAEIVGAVGAALALGTEDREELQRLSARQEQGARQALRQLADEVAAAAPRRAIGLATAAVRAAALQAVGAAHREREASERQSACEAELGTTRDALAFLEGDNQRLSEVVSQLVAGGDPPAAAPFGKCDVVCYSIIPWSFRWQRPQQLLSRLAAAGHRVFVLAMDRTLPPGGPSHTVSRLGPNLWEVVCALPGELRVHSRSLDVESETALLRALEDLRDEQGMVRALSLVQVPSWTGSALAAREQFGWPVIYDCMDEWDGFPKIGRELVADEPRLVEEADLVLVSAGRLLEKWQGAARRTLLLRNAADFAHFASAEPLAELAGLPRPRIGYFGAFAPWVDIELLERIAEQRPGYQLVLAGGVFDVDVSRLVPRPNVRFLGQRPYDEMPGLLAALDVCLIPFVRNPITAATDPIKFWEYLCQGKPIVATALPELAAHGRLHYPAEGAEEFLRQLDRAAGEADPRLRAERIATARTNDWNDRVAAFDRAVAAMFAERAREGESSGRAVGVRPAAARLEETVRLRQKVAALRGFERRNREVQERSARREAELEASLHAVERELGLLREEATREREALVRRLTEEEGKKKAPGDAIAGIGGELQALRGELDLRSRDLAIARELAERHRVDLVRIQTSRLWKAASLYWAARRRFARLLPGQPASRPATARPMTFAAPVAEVGSAGAADGVSRHDLLCLPIIDWDFRFQRPQQLMSQFAAAGHRVFYVAQSFRQDGAPLEITPKRENVFEVSLRGPGLNVYCDAPDERVCEQLFAGLLALRRATGMEATATVVQLPFWWPVAELARERLGWPVVYDCMDHHAGFATNGEAMLALERQLLAGADQVLASSRTLEEEARRHNPKVLLVRNACDFEHFSRVAERVRQGPPTIGYYGAISSWFDVELVGDLARRRPDWRFVLVGSTYGADVASLASLPNVELPGEVPYPTLPDWLSRFDVCIVPFLRTPLTDATNPVKAYEILAAGKPIVAVPLPELEAFGSLVRRATNAPEFAREIEAALAETGGSWVSRRREFARAQTWQARFADTAPAMARAFPLASVVIVTYNNLTWNRTCLEALWSRTEWPNFEVIVVDNGSTDGTREFLAAAARCEGRLRVVLCDSNLGFAAANNRGLALARGEYLILLNNDTAVSRGWLTALIRHLQVDPGLGLVGASTNEIANEAKVEVDYTDLTQMPAWAREFVQRNQGRREPIAMLAMFCLAMRRRDFERIGPLDERFAVGMFEDDDYSRRARELGLEIAVARDAFVHHEGRASFKLLGEDRYLEVFDENRQRYEEKWGRWTPHRRRSEEGAGGRELAQRLSQPGVDPERTVVFLPSIGWSIELVQRPHHLAREFARRGHLVVFDCTGSSAESFAGIHEVEPNLLLFRGAPEELAALPNPVVWALPYNADQVDRWDRRRVVYDFIDDLGVFPYRRRLLDRNHQRMLREADVVLCVSRPLHRAVTESRPDAVYHPNAVEYSRFADPDPGLPISAEFARFADGQRPVAGYYGAIASWLDVDLLMEAARLRPDWGFVILGMRLADAPSLSPLEELPNVLVLPPQRYEHLPAYLARFDVALIPFRVNAITEATSPLKLYEYFASGTPVISSPMPECAAFPEVRIARDGGELAAQLDAARRAAGDPDVVARLRAIAAANSWEARVRELEPRLAAALTCPAATRPKGRPQRP